MTLLSRRSAAAVLLAAIALPAHADGLDTVMSSGALRVAVVTDYPPFGSIGTDMKAQGYDIELAALMAKQMGVTVTLVPVSSANKIPYLIARRADVLFNIGFNEERAKVVDFADPYAPYYIGVFGPSDIKLPALADLAGKTVATTRGSFEELILSKNAPAGTDIKRYEDNATTIAAFMASQTQLIAIGNIVAAALVAQKPARRTSARRRCWSTRTTPRRSRPRSTARSACRWRSAASGTTRCTRRCCTMTSTAGPSASSRH